jgi:hypothetical protein
MGTKRDRSVSPVVGAIFLVGIVLLASSLVVVSGTVAVSDSEDDLQASALEDDLEEMTTTVDAVAMRDRQSARIDFPRAQEGQGVGAFEKQPIGNLEVFVNADVDASGNLIPGTADRTHSLVIGGPALSTDDATYQYALGGIVELTEDSKHFVQDPALDFDDTAEPTFSGRLVIPKATSSGSLSNDIVVNHSQTTDLYRPKVVDQDKAVAFRIQSESPELWRQYFESFEFPESYVDVSGNTVTAVFVAPEDMFVHLTEHEISFD